LTDARCKNVSEEIFRSKVSSKKTLYLTNFVAKSEGKEAVFIFQKCRVTMTGFDAFLQQTIISFHSLNYKLHIDDEASIVHSTLKPNFPSKLVFVA
jgi:hypothetical protein